MEETKLILKSVNVIFANLEDEGFGRSITIDASDKDTEKAITDWIIKNNIGKGERAGKPNFREYEGKKQFALKLNDHSKFAGLNGLSEKDLGYGAKISLVANAFEYDNKFGKGTSSSLSAIVIEKGANTASDADLALLIEPSEEVMKDEIAEALGMTQEEKKKTTVEAINLDDIDIT